jgi:hypothetical protein
MDTDELERFPTKKVGNRPPAAGRGRPKGALNKTTTLIKEAIIIAAEEVGSDGKGTDGLVGYLKARAVDTPNAFMAMMTKVLPTQLAGDEENPMKTINQVEYVIVRP